MIKIINVATLAATALLAVSMAHAEGRSAEEIAATCAACHGQDGNAVIPGYPHLAGQYANYMVKVLEDYKAGKRTGGQAAIMTGQAAGLSEDEMEAIANYYSKMEGKLSAVPVK